MKKRQPKYSLHKPTGQGYVRIDGKFHYLGQFGTRESHAQYERIIAKWLAGTLNVDRETLSVSRLAVLYVDHAREYYRKDGVETSEVHSIQTTLTSHLRSPVLR